MSAADQLPSRTCPQCGDVQPDLDGFGTMYCEKCGYCKHAAISYGVCGFCGARIPESAPTAGRSLRPDVRNPLLALPAFRLLRSALHMLPRTVRENFIAALMELRRDCRERAQKSWVTNKAPMASYWKVCSVYIGHIARALR